MINDIIKNKIFGNVKSNISVIEFQKRGLPHAHILIILEKTDKPRTTDDYDKIITAEIPDKIKFPLLYKRSLSLIFILLAMTILLVLKKECVVKDFLEI